MPTLYEHQKPLDRTLTFADGRISEIDEQIEQLKLEKQMWQSVKKKFEQDACKTCGGSGEVGYYPYGMEDGRRFKTCETCKGAGKP